MSGGTKKFDDQFAVAAAVSMSDRSFTLELANGKNVAVPYQLVYNLFKTQLDQLYRTMEDSYTKSEVNAIASAGIKDVQPSSVNDNLPGLKFPTESGTYSNYGGLVIDITEGLNLIFSDGDTDFKKVLIPIDLSGYLQENELPLVQGKNLFDPSQVKDGKYLTSSTGNILSITGWGVSDWIPVLPGETYTLSGQRGRQGVSFFSSYGSPTAVADSYIGDTNMPLTFTAPTGGNFVVFGLYSSTNPTFSNIQFEEGSQATAYDPYFKAVKLIADKKLAAYAFEKNGLILSFEALAEHGYMSDPKTVKQIEEKADSIQDSLNQISETYTSPNLFDETAKQDGKYLNSTTGDIVSSSGWGISDWIPVTAGGTYILSGTRGRQGVSFFAADGDTVAVSGTLILDSTMPLIFNVPSGANFVVVALYSPTATEFSNIMLQEGDTFNGYLPFGTLLRIKENVLPTTVESTGFTLILGAKNYIDRDIEGKLLRVELQIDSSGPVPVNDIKTFFDGVLVRSTADEAAPYRIDGSTIGGNHNLSANNLNKVTEVYADGVNVTGQTGSFKISESVKIVEYYDLEGANTSGVVANVSMTYVFDKWGGEVIYTDILGVQSVDLQDIMFVMGWPLSGAYSLYVPKALPFSHESVAYDFSNLTSMGSFSPTTRVDFTLDRVVATGILADRAVLVKDGVGLAIGYAPVQDAGISRRRELVNRKALQLNTTGKVYMSAIDSDSIVTLAAGDYYSVVAYKNYFTYSGSTVKKYMVQTNQSYYLYLDFHGSYSGKIRVPNELVGLSFEVIEKSASVTLLSKENTGLLSVSSSAKGYIVIKFTI